MKILSRARAWVAQLWARIKAAAKRAWKAITGLFVAILMSLGLLVTAQDNSVTLNWENATEYDNGDPLPIEDIAETKIWRASYAVGAENDGSVPFTLIDSLTADITTYTDIPGSGFHCYHGTHTAVNGNESAPSGEYCEEIDIRIPGTLQNFRGE